MDSLLPAEDPYCKCQAREDGKLVDPDCDQCVIAEKQGLPLPEECATRPEPSPCDAVGTKSGTVAGECECQASSFCPRSCYLTGRSPKCGTKSELTYSHFPQIGKFWT